MKYQPPADGDNRLDAPLPKYVRPERPEGPKVLPLVRGNRCECPQWTAYQNELLAAGKYTYEELYPITWLCTFDAWDQAHAQDLEFEASKAARRPT